MNNQALANAAGNLSRRLIEAIGSDRPNNRGRKSDLASDLYVRGAAEALGITTTHMSRIITGRSRSGMDLAQRIADLTGCSIEEILAISKARLTASPLQPSSDLSLD